MKQYFIRLFFIIFIFLLAVFLVYPYIKNLSTVANTKRKADVLTISQTLDRYFTDNPGKIFSMLPTDPVEICRTGSFDCAGMVDMSFLTQSGYIQQLPIDPGGSLKEYGTGYFIYFTPEHRIKVYAPTTDLTESIGISTHRFSQ